jgi:branched chain amino acid efflux pump
MTDFMAIVAVGVGSYLFRGIFILALAKKKIPDSVVVVLQFVAPAVLAALIVGLLIDSDGNVAIGVPEVSAFVVGGAVAYKTHDHIFTLIAGMGVFWLVRALM